VLFTLELALDFFICRMVAPEESIEVLESGETVCLEITTINNSIILPQAKLHNKTREYKAH
jgi:hypothetical protein